MIASPTVRRGKQENARPVYQSSLLGEFILIRAIVVLLAACPLVITAQTLTTPLQYTPLETPCRAVDTRLAGGPIAAGTSQSFNPAGGACAIPLPSTGPIVYAI